MKNKALQVLGLSGLLLLAAAFTLKSSNKEIVTLEIGETAPLQDRKMKDISGVEYSLKDLVKENGLLVIFSCNSCPFVIGDGEDSEGWENRYHIVTSVANRAKIGVVLVNSNEAKRDGDDSFEAMKKRAELKKYQAKYVIDTNHELADGMGARTTPHVFLFDKDMKLVYKGAIDDNVKSETAVTKRYLNDAMISIMQGKSIETNSTRQVGCSIKRISK
ncbi:MAG: redoxin domain-containing protein [Flavobacteriales bacterium]